METFVC
jgi:hypothetical protein